MNIAEIIRYYTDLIQENGLAYAKNILIKDGVEVDIIAALEALSLTSPACN